MKNTIPWISVKKSLPKPGDRVLFWAEYQRGGAAGYGYKVEKDGNLWRDESFTDRDGEPADVYTVTHFCYVTSPHQH
jgi:hypothetical protein